MLQCPELLFKAWAGPGLGLLTGIHEDSKPHKNLRVDVTLCPAPAPPGYGSSAFSDVLIPFQLQPLWIWDDQLSVRFTTHRFDVGWTYHVNSLQFQKILFLLSGCKAMFFSLLTPRFDIIKQISAP